MTQERNTIIIEDHSDQDAQSRTQKIQICHQYCVISPCDKTDYHITKSKLTILSHDFNKGSCIQFVQNNLEANFGYPNARLLHRIHTDHFWSMAGKFLIESLLNDSEILSLALNTLNNSMSGMNKLTKYQVYLVLGHMFLGTFPKQMYCRDTSFGRLMSVGEYEDEVTHELPLNLRTNKLKALIRYFCVYCERETQARNNHESQVKTIKQKPGNDKQSYKNQHNPNRNDIIIFQRHQTQRTHRDILEDNVRMIPVEIKLGSYFANDHEINAVSLFTCSTRTPGSRVEGNFLQVEERLWISHPEMLILKIMLASSLQDNEALIIHGAEKYSDLNSVAAHNKFNFLVAYHYQYVRNNVHDCKATSFVFVHRPRFRNDRVHNILTDVRLVDCGLSGCKQIVDPCHKLVSGKYGRNNKPTKNFKMPSDMKFIVQWIAASLCQWDNFTFYVQNQSQQIDYTILTKQLSEHTIDDLVSIVNQFYGLRRKFHSQNLKLMEYIKMYVT